MLFLTYIFFPFVKNLNKCLWTKCLCDDPCSLRLKRWENGPTNESLWRNNPNNIADHFIQKGLIILFSKFKVNNKIGICSVFKVCSSPISCTFSPAGFLVQVPSLQSFCFFEDSTNSQVFLLLPALLHI